MNKNDQHNNPNLAANIQQIKETLENHINKSEKFDGEMTIHLKYMRESMDSMKELVGEDYVTKAEFEPVKKVVYGLVGLILVAVVGALIALVLK